MVYVYDITLNFQKSLYEFYEWRKEDTISHIKRISLIKIKSSVYNDFLDYNVNMDQEILLSIFNKCEYYDNRNILTIPYALLITDSYRVMALEFNLNGYICKYSPLLLEEEEEIIEVSKRLKIMDLKYSKNEFKNIDIEKTRTEKIISNYIKKDLDVCYQTKNISKLKYLYYEYFNKECNDIDVIFYKLMNEIDNNFNNKHYNLYNLIKLSLSGKNV